MLRALQELTPADVSVNVPVEQIENISIELVGLLPIHTGASPSMRRIYGSPTLWSVPARSGLPQRVRDRETGGSDRRQEPPEDAHQRREDHPGHQ